MPGPEAPAAAAASPRAARPRCSAPTAPLAVLLAAPPPAPHRRDPGRTSGRAHRGGRAARRPQTRGAAAASPGPSATAEAEAEEEAGGCRRQPSGGGASSSACGRLRERGRGPRNQRREQPGSPGRPDVAGTQRRLVLPHAPRRPAAPGAGVAARRGGCCCSCLTGRLSRAPCSPDFFTSKHRKGQYTEPPPPRSPLSCPA